MEIKFPLSRIDFLLRIDIQPSEENLAIRHISYRTQKLLIHDLFPGIQGIIINFQIRGDPKIPKLNLSPCVTEYCSTSSLTAISYSKPASNPVVSPVGL